MADKKYGEFDNFDDFFQDILNELDESSEKSTLADKSSVHVARDGENGSVMIPVNDTISRKSETNSDRNNDLRNKKEKPRIADNEKPELRKPEANEPNDAITKHASNQLGRSLLFLIALGLVTVAAWAIPLRPTASVSEKRNLDRFPVFSASSLLSGDYFKSIDNWFSDTFTFRESWISAADEFKKIYGIKTIAIYGDIPVSDAVPVPAPVTDIEQPEISQNDASEIEGIAEIEELPATEETLNSEQMDIVLSEEDEDEWKGLVIDDDAQIADVGAKIQIGGNIFSYAGFSKTYADIYANIINKAGNMLEGKANFYCILVPHSVTSMLSRADRERIGITIEEDTFAYIYSKMNSNVTAVNVISNLQKHNDEYIVFRSDPHWTALGAYYAYEEWCKVTGRTPVPLSEYKEYAWEDFFGTYYYTAGMPKEIKNNPDIVYAYEPPGDVHLYMDYNNGLKLGTETSLLLDRSTRKVDQYITFLGTDKAKATFINNDIDDDSAVLVLKTSYGNPFVYYLTQHYHYVYVVDIRYFKYSVSKFMEYNKIDDVILIHMAERCYTSDGCNTVSRLLK